MRKTIAKGPTEGLGGGWYNRDWVCLEDDSSEPSDGSPIGDKPKLHCIHGMLGEREAPLQSHH